MKLEQILWLLDQKEQPLSDCYSNCHVRGLTSIRLIDNKEAGGLRIFIAEPNHELWKNKEGAHPTMSLGYHAHRRDIVLQHIAGSTLFNMSANISTEFAGGWSRPLFRYDTGSPIINKMNGGKTSDLMTVRRSKKVYYASDIQTTALRHDSANESMALPAEQHHTVYVKPGTVCIWAVHEGRIRQVTDHFYTNVPDIKAGWNAGLYHPIEPRHDGQVWLANKYHSSPSHYLRSMFEEARREASNWQ
jgi:hypothetical protein